MKNYFSKYITIILLFIIISCSSTKEIFDAEKSTFKIIDEIEPRIISLEGEISERKSEISGLCWFNDFLLLLPQYPNFLTKNENGIIYYIKKGEINNYLFSNASNVISPKTFKIDLSDLDKYFNEGSGFEGISVIDNKIFLTIESMKNGEMQSLIISGDIDSTNKTISLDKNSIKNIPVSAEIFNLSCEAIASKNDTIIPIYEANGKNVNPNTFVNIFNNNLEIQEKINFPNVEYRITDATIIDENGKFWAINYLFPKDGKKLIPAEDQLFIRYGTGKTHRNSKAVERIVEFELKNHKISITDKQPVYIKLLENDSRNWEGLAKLDEKGFLVITDTFPQTIFAFIPYNFSYLPEK